MDKIWFNSYQPGVPYDIDSSLYASLVDLVDVACAKHADKVAFTNLGYELTYKELQEKSVQFASYLKKIKLSKGARVAIMMPNLLQYPIAILGILRAGCVVVNTNPLYTADELTHQLNDSGAEVLIVLANFASVVEKALPHLSIKNIIITQIGDILPWPKRSIVNFVVKYIKKIVPKYTLTNTHEFNEAFESSVDKTIKWPSVSHEDIAFLQYTGGTTGVAKAAVLTHGNMVANVLQAYHWIKPLMSQQQDIIVTALPLYHIFSLTANCLTFIKAGAKNILITNPRDIPGFINIIKNSKFTTLTGVNTLFNALLNHEKFKTIDFSHLKLTLSGGMALQKSVALRWRAQTHTRILEAYGLTETSPAVTINPMNLEEYNGSIGLPVPSTEISIRNDNGEELAVGEIGELCVKGPQVMQNYWKKQDETALIFTQDGFLKTGDIARVDEQGFVYLVDRKKDMILVSGFNVYPNEIEQVISTMPGVSEVGVVGVIGEDSRERVKACVVKKDKALTEEDIIAHCREFLTAYKVPKIIEFFDELPKNNVGKILRRALRDPLK